MDGTMTKAPLGGGATGHNPTDRSKQGTKRSLMTEGAGIPVGLAIAGANRHDMKLVAEFGSTAHIPVRGKSASTVEGKSRFKPRRWVVERTHSWMNRFRRILIRWEKKKPNYLAMLHFSCALIACRQCQLG
jgi:putative transposase